MPSPGIVRAISAADFYRTTRGWKDKNLKRKASRWLGVLQLNKSVVTDNRAKSSDIRTIRPQLTSGDPAA